MKRAFLLLASVVVLSIASTATADEKPIEVPMRIKSRVPKPMVTIEVRRVAPALGVNDLGKPLVARIEEAVSKEPF